MTRFAFLLLGGFLVVSASVGAAFVALQRAPSAAAEKSMPSWGVISPARWDALGRHLAREGFVASRARVVAAAPPLALVSVSRRSGAACLIVVRNGIEDVTMCGRARTLRTFTSSGGDPSVTNLVGVVPLAVVNVQQQWIADGRPQTTNAVLMQAHHARVFASTLSGTGAIVLAARSASGRVLFRTTLAR